MISRVRKYLDCCGGQGRKVEIKMILKQNWVWGLVVHAYTQAA
jgi:hypothetical protein